MQLCDRLANNHCVRVTTSAYCKGIYSQRTDRQTAWVSAGVKRGAGKEVVVVDNILVIVISGENYGTKKGYETI